MDFFHLLLPPCPFLLPSFPDPSHLSLTCNLPWNLRAGDDLNLKLAGKENKKSDGLSFTLPSTRPGNRNIANYQPFSSPWSEQLQKLTQQTLITHSPSLFSGWLFMTTVTSQLCFYFEPGDGLVVTSEHVLRCGGLMGCNHCKRANLFSLRYCPAIPVAALNHAPDSAR